MAKSVQKMINFDLDQAKLKQFYPGKDHTYAYRQIGFFLKKNGFEHSQGSGYVSKDKLYKEDISIIVKKLIITNPWLTECLKAFTATDITRHTDLMHDVYAVADENKLIRQHLQQHTRQDKHFSR